MNSKIPIRELVSDVLAELKRLNYSENTLNTYRRFYNRLITFADSRKETNYSEELGNTFLKTQYKFDLNNCDSTLPRTVRSKARFIRVLGDYQLHGVILRRKPTKAPYVRPPQFADALIAFEKECVLRNYSKGGMRTRIDRLRLFIDYLDDCGLTSLSELTAQELSNYTATLVGYNSKSVAAVLTVLRTFLKFLCLKGYHPKDLSSDVPSVKNSYYPSIPSAWKGDDVKRMLDCIDRGSPTGKRDYAILLIVTRLGMRVQDLKEIKLSNLKWDARKIEIVQHKTKQAVSYPLLDDIGWAIIDYLKNGRPQTTSPHLFVRHNAPFEAFGTHANLHNIITKYTRLAGIELPRGSKRGMHSLRHTLASVLLEQHTPLPVISEILGHMSVLSTSVYLKIDLEGLRKCALDPEEVFNYADN
jgi:site-specific recombinase XerD